MTLAKEEWQLSRMMELREEEEMRAELEEDDMMFTYLQDETPHTQVKTSAKANAKRCSIASSEEYARMQGQLDIQRAAKITGQSVNPRSRGRLSLGGKDKNVEAKQMRVSVVDSEASKNMKPKAVLWNNNISHDDEYVDGDHESTPLSSKGRGRGKTGMKRAVAVVQKPPKPVKSLARTGHQHKTVTNLPTATVKTLPAKTQKLSSKPPKMVPHPVKTYKNMLYQKKVQAAKATITQQKIPKPPPVMPAFIPSPDDGSRKSSRARRPSVRLDLESNLTDITSPKFARMYHSLLGSKLIISNSQSKVTTGATIQTIQAETAISTPVLKTNPNQLVIAGQTVSLASVGVSSDLNRALPQPLQNQQLAGSPKVIIQDIGTAMKSGKLSVVKQLPGTTANIVSATVHSTPIRHVRTQSAAASVQKQRMVPMLQQRLTSHNIEPPMISQLSSSSVNSAGVCTNIGVTCDSSGQGILMTSDGTPLILNDRSQLIVQQSPPHQMVQQSQIVNAMQPLHTVTLPHSTTTSQPMKILLIQKPNGGVVVTHTPQPTSQPQYILTTNAQGKQILTTSTPNVQTISPVNPTVNPTVQAITARTKPTIVQQAKSQQVLINPSALCGVRTTQQVIQTSQGPVLATIQQQNTQVTPTNISSGGTLLCTSSGALIQTPMAAQPVNPSFNAVRALSPPSSSNHVVRLNQGRSSVNLATIAAHKSAVMGTVKQRLAVADAHTIDLAVNKNILQTSPHAQQPRQVFLLPTATNSPQNNMVRTPGATIQYNQQNMLRYSVVSNNNAKLLQNASHSHRLVATNNHSPRLLTHNILSTAEQPTPVPILEKMAQQLTPPRQALITDYTRIESHPTSSVKPRNLFQDLGHIT